jgi:hypothetical protein
LALAVYVVTVLVFALLAGERLASHSPYNHFAHLADAWAHGRHDIIPGGPSYAGGNDFAQFGGKTFISFPPMPAVLMLPLAYLAGSPENFRDAQFIVWLAGVGPAFLFLALERLRLTARSSRTELENLALAFVFAFGSVYFFTAVQGTVWFAGHVVGVGILAMYLYAALDAERPWLSGLLIGCAFLTRPTMSYTALFFGLELLRVCRTRAATSEGPSTTFEHRVAKVWRELDRPRFARELAKFSAPILACLTLAALYNHARFQTYNPTAFGHEHLTVQWHARIEKWGLFSAHYLPKNLGCVLTILPWPRPHLLETLFSSVPQTEPPFRINEHGLALWFTTPIYLWLLYPKQWNPIYRALLLSAALPFLQNLLYQNSGWQQFGYRFSNDYSVLLFAAIAVGGRPMGRAFKVAALWGIAWNAFGALSFGRTQYERFYFREGTQTVIYQPD